jgi:ElaB/YqjD/DUF883 family membrane-anchored ribosome-binding protein
VESARREQEPDQEFERIEAGAQAKADEAQRTASGYFSQAQEEIDARREKAAGSLHVVADRLRQTGSEVAQLDEQALEKLARGVDSTADYIERHSTREMWEDARDYVQKHPMAAVAAAVVFGFMVGRILGR